MPHHTLDIFHRTFLLSKTPNRPPDHLKSQLRQFEICGQLTQNSFAKVIRIDERSLLIRENEGLGRWIWTRLSPKQEPVHQVLRNMDDSQTPSSFFPKGECCPCRQFQ